MPPCLFLHFLLISGLQNLGFLAEKGLLISICAAFARYEKLDYLECVLFFEDFSVGFAINLARILSCLKIGDI